MLWLLCVSLLRASLQLLWRDPRTLFYHLGVGVVVVAVVVVARVLPAVVVSVCVCVCVTRYYKHPLLTLAVTCPQSCVALTATDVQHPLNGVPSVFAIFWNWMRVGCA